MWKLIQIDGYSRDSIADKLIIDKITNVQAAILCEAYCKAFGSAEIWFRVVPDDYALSRGMEDLV